MEEHPLLMTTANVKATLEGRKTMTRRTRGLEKINQGPDTWALKGQDLFRHWLNQTAFIFEKADGQELILKCPYGQVGDRLWLRETWQYRDEPREVEEDDLHTWIYYADGSCRLINRRTLELEEEDILTADSENEMKWRPSIFMPRWASRINLEIVGLRPERLWEITEADSIAEGMIPQPFDTCDLCCEAVCSIHQPVLGQFHNLWDSINAKRGYPWKLNNWVWVIEWPKYRPNSP